jgi:thiosulfate/3-mercaptopyruvate sulfurtransferase
MILPMPKCVTWRRKTDEERLAIRNAPASSTCDIVYRYRENYLHALCESICVHGHVHFVKKPNYFLMIALAAVRSNTDFDDSVCLEEARPMPQDPVIEIKDVGGLSNVMLLDVRDKAAFDADHADGAVRVPVEAWVEAARNSETSFADVGFWQQQISHLGVGAKTSAIIFDDGRLTEAARVWFILQYFGATAYVLNGGWDAVKGSEITNSETQSGTQDPFVARPGVGTVGLIEREALKDEIGNGAVIFDARTQAEFDGLDLKNNARGGHLPGARLLSHSELLEGKRLKPAATLHRLIDDAGFQPGDHIVTHCDGGGRAALAAVAAARAGYPDVRVYYLSFFDWAKDESCPIV